MLLWLLKILSQQGGYAQKNNTQASSLIAELTDAWAYGLPDGTGTPRQMVDANGEITLASSYTPWGDTLSVSGTGAVMQGYFGGIMDTATGLIYVGNGQYYDPSTGRFLNRNANPNSANPYVPWGGNPTSALMAPLFLLALIYSRKRKRGKLDTFVILLVLCLGVSMSIVACGPTVEATLTTTPSPIPSPTPTATATVAVAGTTIATIPAVAATPSPSPVPCQTVTMIFTPTPTPDLEPWKRYVDYDPISKTIPASKWGDLDNIVENWDETRVELVLKWLDDSGGGWWGTDLIKLAQWLLEHEGGEMLHQTDEDNVYEQGNGQNGAKYMIRFMHRLFNDGRSDILDLARFTCFFNADHTSPFTEEDWRLLHTPPSNSAVNTVNDFWGLEPMSEELTWWEPFEHFPYTPFLTVKHPNIPSPGGDIMYFAYK